MLENMSKKEREDFEKAMRRTVRNIKINEFHDVVISKDYEVLDAIVKTLDYVLVLFETKISKHDMICLLKEWELITDIKRLSILDDMEYSQPADED